MPVEGLPLLLENVLMDIMDTSQVSSWTIKGGNEYGQVTIRFKMAPMCSVKQAEVKYRKEPPSRTRRDMRRAGTHKNSDDMKPDLHPVKNKSYEDNFLNSDIADDTTVNLCTAGISLSPINNDTVPCLSPVVQVDGPPDGASGSQLFGSQPSEPNNGSGARNNLVQHATSIDSGVTNMCHHTFSCSKCGIDINQGKRCLLCANIFICEDCFNEGFHKQCKFVIGDFDIDKVPNQLHCHGCFKPFADLKSIFKCASCKNYCQCPNCQVGCVHYYHREYLEETPIDDIT